MSQNATKIAHEIFEAWNRTWKENDLEGFLALYSEDVVLESPLFPYLLGIERGVIKGKQKLKEVIEIAAKRKPTYRNFHVSNYFTDGLIVKHRIYWGWLGVNTILNDTYYR